MTAVAESEPALAPQEDRATVLLSAEQLEAHARALAAAHVVAPAPGRGVPLLPRLDAHAERLEEAFQYLSAIARTDPQPVGSEDWLRDNYHVALEQIREIRQDLPRRYYLELPKLAAGPRAGYPRVYDLARELVIHTAGRLDLDTIVDFTRVYQQGAPLSIGETWAIAIMLRVALVEELRAVVDRITAVRRSRERAQRWEARWAGGQRAVDFGELFDAERRAHGRLSAAFVVELLQWLRDQPLSAAPAWTALQEALEAQGDSADLLLRQEQAREAADQVAIGNAITSMRLLSAIDWPLFFDRVSVVEQILRDDPAGAYAIMDAATRDRYRHSVEQLARRAGRGEVEIARHAVHLAREAAAAEPGHDRRHHVGYYLISRGRLVLERAIDYPPRLREHLARFVFRHPAIGYIGMIVAAVALSVASLLAYASRWGAAGWELALVALVVLIPVSELAISVLNAVLTAQVPPRGLPRLDLRAGIPASHRTIVVIPAIVDSRQRLAGLFHDLEVRFLANRDPHLHFALLADWPDADRAQMPREDDLLQAARRTVAELDARHGAGTFLYFHRERRWNATEERWMGWERKRGKLAEFNELLRGDAGTSFTVQYGRLDALASIRYVITLDSDTQLPLDAARALVGTLAHPLNRPRVDPRIGRVVEGYGVLQPRVAVSLESANGTAFAQVFAGHVGIDPYTTAVSDVYQDLFHEGSYVGKGIYDVDAFRQALADRVPENRLLSHDLFEGSFARTGLCTDTHVVDDYPPHYLAFSARQQRWVRGDWQIARWAWPTVPDASGATVPNVLPAIARWKILDNLRRSLIAPSLVGLFVAGWTVLPGSGLTWSLLGVLILAFPAYVQVGRSLSSRIHGVPLREHLRAEHTHLVTSARQAFLHAAFLLHEAWVMVDAIGRTLVRLHVTRRRLLEWVTADRTSRGPSGLADVLRRMWFAPPAAAAIAALVAAVEPARLPLALPAVVLWGASPWIAHRTGRPLVHHAARVDDDERRRFRRVARRIWRFYEELVGPEDRWLVPDNIQENRRELVAHRTSPTNIGLQLLSTLAARDFGFVSLGGVVQRLESTAATLQQMPRYRGHLFNWYDTRTLEPLAPAYISTVDSGNWAGYLLTLRSGLVELVGTMPIVDGSMLAGLTDLLDLCEEDLASALGGRSHHPWLARWRGEQQQLRSELAGEPATLAGWIALLPALRDRFAALGVLLQELEETSPAQDEAALRAIGEAEAWLRRGVAALEEQRGELERLAGWAPLVAAEGGGAAAAPLGVPTLRGLVRWIDRHLASRRGADTADALGAALAESRRQAVELADRASALGSLAGRLAGEIDFAFLFNHDRQLFSIGFNVADGRLDSSYYDTLASEARLASFVAIATGQVPTEHWFKLARSLTPSGTARALLSWSASMFEYLMPLVVMRSYPATLLEETYHAIVRRHIHYGAQRGVPWGISESAYHLQDLAGNYQYRAFGVPGLGLKRGLADDLVVAPYACLLAAPLAPTEALANLERLRGEGMAGRYGYYEAIDYTAERRPPSQPAGGVVLPTYMAHHQGMSLLALDNLLNAAAMQRRFHADLRVQAAELLLHERIPQLAPLANPPIEQAARVPVRPRAPVIPGDRYITPHTLSPRGHLLSNGSYSVMVTNAGAGYSARGDLALTRWRQDLTADGWGAFCYVRDLDTGDLWSTAYQPTRREPEEYEVTFAPDRAVWRRRDRDIELRTEIAVSPEDDVEVRRVWVTNHGGEPRRLDLTTYAEVVLAPPDADLAHPAFSNLFVETLALPERDAIVCARRLRAGTDRPHVFHVLSGRGLVGEPTQYETDRLRFIGRGRSLERPAALDPQAALSGTTGPVLDPIVSLRRALVVPPGGTARVSYAYGFADTEEQARRLIEKYHDRRAVAHAFQLAGTHSQIELRHLGLTVEETMRFQRLAARMIHGDPRLRSHAAAAANTRAQTALWPQGISGDVPILLVRLRDDADVPLFRDLLKAHEYLRLKGFAFDLVVVNEHAASYLQDLQHLLLQLVAASPEQAWTDRRGGIFVRRADLLSREDLTLLEAVARVVMDGADGRLREQLKRPYPARALQTAQDVAWTPPAPAVETSPAGPAPVVASPQDREFDNGHGGFVDGGREYAIDVDLDARRVPPAPWSNVVAHPTFGFAASECHTGYTWSGNSHDNRLTPWRNDPVSDSPGEVLYLRDEESGEFWSATPLPAGGGQSYTVRHGHGYSVYEHARGQLSTGLTAFVPPDETVKVFRLTIRNTATVRRRISVTLFVEWVLGENRSRTAPHVVTAADAATGAMLAHNAFRQQFPDRVAFLDLSAGEAERTVTGDRTEFIGRNGTLARPAAMARPSLLGRVGAAMEPCGAVRLELEIPPLEERTVIGLLGDAPGRAEARALVRRFRDPRAAEAALQQARGFWTALLGRLTVRTPDRSMDLLLNGWLPYQTLACRIWGRSAFYQSSGAFGFRDQLQDVLAFLLTAPHLAREHLLEAASRQFVEGDVQHWWHEPGGQGVRTRFSDDRLWLVYATLAYVSATGDRSVLDEAVPFLQGRVLDPGEHEAYETPEVAPVAGSLYEHCVRAVAVSLDTGAHGLPLIGTGDWNDGMNLVGSEGRGESVWLAWFLASLLRPFADLAASRGDDALASTWRRHADAVIEAAEAAWDGGWYRRAYFDDGTPLGSKENLECQIDAIAQSWAVLGGGGDPERARQAMQAVDERLIRPADRLVLLLTPPFDRSTPSPGYIQGYVPGVRENGGQYTHAALWTVLAFARLGDGDRAAGLFSSINPINHTRTPAGVARYRAEPYVVAADVYSNPAHVGRGGWTWYTGSAGWMYRVGVEGILGIGLREGRLHLDPCIPRGWPGYEATLKMGDADLAIVVENPRRVSRGVRRVLLDGAAQEGDIPLASLSGSHEVRVELG